VCIWWAQYKTVGPNNFNAQYDRALKFRTMNMWQISDEAPEETKQAALSNIVYEPGDKSVVVSGDWLYMKNHDYKEILETKDIRKKGEIPENPELNWSGENAFASVDGNGGRIYIGLGVDPSTEAELRTKMITRYNEAFSDLFNKNIQVGDEIVAEMTQARALNRIKFVTHDRPKNLQTEQH